jgi:inhibitor of the pro-sigma K processing machinery
MRAPPAAKGLDNFTWRCAALESLLKSLPWLVGGLILVIALAVLRRPLKWLLSLLARTGVGLGVLYVLSHVGGLLGLNLGVNLVNALVLGVLGVPGFGLLLMTNWVLAT